MSPLPSASTAASQETRSVPSRKDRIGLVLEAVLLVVALATSLATFEHFFVRRQPLLSAFDGGATLLQFGLGLGALASACALLLVKRREPASVATLLRQAFVCFIGAAILCVVVVQPYRRLAGVGLLGFAAIGFASWRLASPLIRRFLPRRLGSAIAFSVFQICLFALLGEIALRQFARFRPSPVFARAGAGAEQGVAAARYAPGTVRFEFRCNSLGFYDDEWNARVDGKRRVALIGDSFVVGIVPHYFHFGTVCERECGAEVCAVGLPGIGPFEYVNLLETDGLALDPDMVVISIFVGNDFIEAAQRYVPSSFGRDWLDSENVLLQQVPRRLSIVRAETEKLGHAAGGVQGESSKVEKITNDPTELVKDFPWLDDPSRETENMTAPRYLTIEINRALGSCRADAPEPQSMYAALRAIRKLCDGRPLGVLVIPDEFQVDDELWSDVVKGTPGVPLDRGRPQQLLARFLGDEGIPFLDVLPLLRSAPLLQDGKPHVYSLRDSHINRRGNEIVGKALAEFLRENLAKLEPR